MRVYQILIHPLIKSEQMDLSRDNGDGKQPRYKKYRAFFYSAPVLHYLCPTILMK